MRDGDNVVAERETDRPAWTKERHNSITPFRAWYEANPYSLVIPTEKPDADERTDL